jgi:mono/diheme cytochrome c family protein
VRIATAVAGGLALAAAVMAVLAFTSGGDGGGQSAAPATAGQTADGKAVWLAQGCGSCHTLAAVNAHGDIGPDLAATLKGAPASYVRESIVNPNAHAAPGFSTAWSASCGRARADRYVLITTTPAITSTVPISFCRVMLSERKIAPPISAITG